MDNKSFRLTRLAQEKSQWQIAEMLGVSAAQLSMYERHGYPMPERAMSRLETVLMGIPATTIESAGRLRPKRSGGLYIPPNTPFFYYDFRLGGKRFRGSTGKTEIGAATKVLESKKLNIKTK